MPKATSVGEYLAALPNPLRDIGRDVQEIIDVEWPEAAGGVIWHGHPVWRIADAPACLIKAYSSYVTFGFFGGETIDDPAGRLESGARGMASVKLRGADDIDTECFADWLRQARELQVARA